MKHKLLLFLIVPLLLAVSCEKDPASENNAENNTENNTENENGNGNESGGKTQTVIDLQGSAQKGQLVKGSQVTAFALNDQLLSLGTSYPAAISNDLGSFKVSAVTEANYLELRAEGYYFVENTGELASNPIYLQAIVESKDKNANINLLTTLTVSRIKHLVASGSSFAEAKSQAQNEILKALSKGAYSSATTDFDDMDISKNSDANALLLALSCLLQEGRSTAQVMELVSEISADFEITGTVSDPLVKKLYANKDSIDILAIIKNMKNFYANKGISDYSIPAFYKFVNDSYANSFVVLNTNDFKTDEWSNTLTTNRLSKDGIAFDLFFLSPKEVFFHSVDAEGKNASYDWVQVSIEAYEGIAYVAHFSVKANPDIWRYAYINLTDSNGSILQSLCIDQDTGLQVINIPNTILLPGNESTTKSSIIDQLTYDPIPAGTDVLVNGKTYTIPDSRQIAVPMANNYFIGYPANRVNSTGGYYFEVDYPTKVYDDFFAYYCYLENVEKNPVEAILWNFTGRFCIASDNDFYMLRLTANNGAQIAGLRRYDPIKTYTIHDTGYYPGAHTNTVELYDIEDDNEVAFSLPPQTLTHLTLEVYDKNYQLLATKEMSRTISIEVGQLIRTRIAF